MIHILLIEDNPGDARLITEMLAAATSARFTVETRSRLTAGLERLQQGDIHVVLLDLSLPDSHGLQTVEQLMPQARSAPVIVLTGNNDREVGMQALQQGAQDYLNKSEITPSLLERAIRYAVERYLLQTDLRSQALTDELTGLANRRYFLALAQQQLKIAWRQEKRLLLLVIDLDEFKPINDQYGHATGDDALIQIADLLRYTFRASDIVGRIGGDEFIVLAVDTNPETDQKVLARLQKNLAAHNAQTAKPYHLALTVGAAVLNPGDTTSLEELMRQADQALYANKRKKKSNGRNAHYSTN